MGAFSRSLSTDLCGADIRVTQPWVHTTQHNVQKTHTKALQLMTIANITTHDNNICVTILQFVEN